MRKAVFIHQDWIPEGKDFEDLTDDQLIEICEEYPEYVWVYDSWEEFVRAFNDWDAPNYFTSHARMVDFPD